MYPSTPLYYVGLSSGIESFTYVTKRVVLVADTMLLYEHGAGAVHQLGYGPAQARTVDLWGNGDLSFTTHLNRFYGMVTKDRLAWQPCAEGRRAHTMKIRVPDPGAERVATPGPRHAHDHSSTRGDRPLQAGSLGTCGSPFPRTWTNPWLAHSSGKCATADTTW
ncbi:hypothetical protein GCM10010425_83590 [Streptomyces spororaveus]